MSRDDVEAVVAAARKKNERAKLRGANLTRVPVPVYEANLKGADLSGVDLSGANLHGANLGRTDLTGANLAGANLTRVPLYEANLKGADLSGADLTGANLTWVSLTGANLTGANLQGVLSWEIAGKPAALPPGWLLIEGYLVGPGAKLYGAKLRGADLTDVNLTGVNLGNADLEGTSLRGAILTGTNLEDANLTEANLADDPMTLIDHEVPEVRAWAAQRITDPTVLMQLALDDEEVVRAAVLENGSATDEIRVAVTLRQ